MNRWIAVSFFFLAGCSGLMAQCSLPGSDVLPNLREIYAKLIVEHPYAHYDNGRNALDSVMLVLEKEGKQLADRDSVGCTEFLQLVAHFQRLTGDGHFYVRPEETPDFERAMRKRYLPLHLIELADGRFVSLVEVSQENDTLRKGTEILEIQGRAVGPLVEEMAVVAGSNDAGYDKSARYHVARHLSYRYQLFYGLQDSVLLRLVIPEGDTTNYWLRTEILEEETAEPPKKRGKKIIQDAYTLAPLEDDSLSYLMKISTWSDDKMGKLNFRSLTRKYFAEILDADAERLIIDIRNNTGGSLGNVDYFLSFLSEGPYRILTKIGSYSPSANGNNFFSGLGNWLGGVRRRNGEYVLLSKEKPSRPRPASRRFNGEVVILTNTLSFSASGILANYLQGSRRATVVGQKTGASNSIIYGGSAQKFKVGSPESRFDVSFMNWRLIEAYPRPGTVTPDVLVPITLELLLSEDDEVLRVAKELKR